MEELRKLEATQVATTTFAPSLLEDIEQHDVIHVVFGCPTNLQGEVLAHIWSLLGTDMSVKRMGAVNMHADHRETLRSIGHLNVLKMWVNSFPAIVKTIWNASRMTKRLQVTSYRHLLFNRRLNDLRSEFNIKITKL